MMTVDECIKNRRSIRKFTDEAVSHSILEEIIETASYSPSWKNSQVVRYIAVEGDLKNKIASDCTTSYSPNGTYIADAPIVVALTVIKGRCGFERDGSFSTDKKDSWQMFDAGIAAQTFCLSAHDKGLGTVILGIFDGAAVTSLLAIPDEQELVCLICLGHPAEQPATPKRKAVEHLLSYQL